MIAIVFPTEFEAKGLIGRLHGAQKHLVEKTECWRGKMGEADILIGVVGIGAEIAARKARHLVEEFQPHVLILTGFAGALIPELQIGQILVAQNYLNEQQVTDLKFLGGFDFGQLHTSTELVADPDEKRQMAAQTDCQFVDMEASGVVDVALYAEARFYVVRAISDFADQTLPRELLSCLCDPETGKPTPIRALLHMTGTFENIVRIPEELRLLKEFVAPLTKVRENLTEFLVKMIEDLE